MKQIILFIALFFSVSAFAQTEQVTTAAATDNPFVSLNDAVSTFPNPVIKDLNISVESSDFKLVKWQLMDILGNVVMEQDVYELQRVKIDMSGQNSEIYLLQLYDANGNKVTKRIIKR